VLERLDGDPALLAVARPLLEARRALLAGVEALHRQLLAAVRADPACRRLMTVPGVGEAAS
jgi:transposase